MDWSEAWKRAPVKFGAGLRVGFADLGAGSEGARPRFSAERSGRMDVSSSLGFIQRFKECQWDIEVKLQRLETIAQENEKLDQDLVNLQGQLVGMQIEFDRDRQEALNSEIESILKDIEIEAAKTVMEEVR